MTHKEIRGGKAKEYIQHEDIYNKVIRNIHDNHILHFSNWLCDHS